MRIVISGLIATFPLGGVAWDYGQYVGGLRRLGHEVFYIEDTGHWFYDPPGLTFTDDATRNVAYLASVMERFDAGGNWTLRDSSGRYWGRSERETAEWCASADVLINISGSLWLRPEYARIRRKIYLDTDPGYTQAKIQRVLRGDFTPEEKDFLSELRCYDLHATFAENIGQPDCLLPTDLVQWHPTRQPILLDEWLPSNSKPETRNSKRSWTTVMSWRTDEKAPLIAGRTYGGKDVEFKRFLDLPRQVNVPMEIALSGPAPREQLAGMGWQLVDGYAASRDLECYRSYIANSSAEWSIAKQAYVATHSGWFSGRTACYLASGRPAVVQETGWSKFYPSGRGMVPFNNMEEAVAGVRAVEGEYETHSHVAREIATEYFDSSKVLKELLGMVP